MANRQQQSRAPQSFDMYSKEPVSLARCTLIIEGSSSELIGYSVNYKVAARGQSVEHVIQASGEQCRRRGKRAMF